MFTGNRDIDEKILLGLNEPDFLNLCALNRYLSDICEKTSYKNRLFKNYPGLFQFSSKPENISWKQFYMETIYWISKLKEKFNFIFTETGIDPKMYYNIIDNSWEGKHMLMLIGESGFYDPHFINFAFLNEGIYKFDDEKTEIIEAFSNVADPIIRERNLLVIKSLIDKY